LSVNSLKKILVKFASKDESDCQLYRFREGFTIKTKSDTKSIFMKMDFNKVLPKITFDEENLTI